MKVKCICSEYSEFTKDKIYEVFIDDGIYPCVIDDDGHEYIITGDSYIFEVVQQDNIETSQANSPQKSLRDEFAMAAMIGDWAAQVGGLDDYSGSTQAFKDMLQAAKSYYMMADAMLKVREENANTNE